MSVTNHKILIHGAIIITVAILPIGMSSKDVPESRNKDLWNYREHHIRKISKKKYGKLATSITDIIGRLGTSQIEEFSIKSKFFSKRDVRTFTISFYIHQVSRKLGKKLGNDGGWWNWQLQWL